MKRHRTICSDVRTDSCNFQSIFPLDFSGNFWKERTENPSLCPYLLYSYAYFKYLTLNREKWQHVTLITQGTICQIIKQTYFYPFKHISILLAFSKQKFIVVRMWKWGKEAYFTWTLQKGKRKTFIPFYGKI